MVTIDHDLGAFDIGRTEDQSGEIELMVMEVDADNGLWDEKRGQRLRCTGSGKYKRQRLLFIFGFSDADHPPH